MADRSSSLMQSSSQTDFRLPSHVGIIPDGNRRWAEARGQPEREGYAAGIEPGFDLLDACQQLEIEEVSIYGFTKENVRRPSGQVEAFRVACTKVGLRLAEEGVALRVVGDTSSTVFPDPLKPFANRRIPGDLRVNLLVNYGWQWDLKQAIDTHTTSDGCQEGRAHYDDSSSEASDSAPLSSLASSEVSRVDLVIRWGGHRRLSGFLPAQCAYADIYVVDRLWPDMQVRDFFDALDWYQRQDVTLGG